MTATITNVCRLCDGKTQNILDLGWTPLANALCDEPTPNVPRYPLALARCDTCGHFQLPVRVEPAELFPPTYPYASGSSASMRQHLDEVAQLVADNVPHGGLVLEIGCNDGYLLGLLNHHHRLGVVGVDPAASDEAVLGYHVIRESWGSRELPMGEFDAIVALNVFAHVADLRRSIEQCAAVLKPGGLLLFEVGYFPAMVEQNVFDTIYHEHLDYHTLGALVPFLKRHGFDLWHAERIPVQGGSIRSWCVKTGSVLGGRTSDLQGLLDAERRTLDDLSGYLSGISFTRKWFREHNVRMMPIIGYGCPAKAATLLSTCQMIVDAFVDDSPLKIGKYAPDGRTPILANSAELDNFRVPDDCGGHESFGYAGVDVVLFAWNMAEEVMGRLKASPARCLREARVLVPFPEPHYVE